MSAGEPLGTVIVEAGGSVERLVETLDGAMVGVAAGRHRVVVLSRRGEAAALAGRLPERFRALPVVAIGAGLAGLVADTPRVAFLPAEAVISRPRWTSIPIDGMVLRPWALEVPSAIGAPVVNMAAMTGWAAPAGLLGAVLQDSPESLDFFAVEACLARRGIAVGFLSAPAFAESVGPPPVAAGAKRLRRDAAVLAIVPHFRCEAWLSQCLRSLVRQTRPLAAIVVVDDASPTPPVDIVAAFPGVTLMRARENVGPYRLVQTVIERTRFDACLFQDADDWSSDDRLALLLECAEASGAELVGGQEMRFDISGRQVRTCAYPLDAGRAIRTNRQAAILHPSSLVSRDLVMRVGGFASGMRFGGDAEFQMRMQHVAHAVNVPHYCYFRRRREGSLWTSPETGRDSAARRAQWQHVSAQAAANEARVARGEAPDLTPFRVAGPVAMDHLAGPVLLSP